jgi:hypothetical protein
MARARAHAHTHTPQNTCNRQKSKYKKGKIHTNKRMAVEKITKTEHKTITILVNLKGKVKVGQNFRQKLQ